VSSNVLTLLGSDHGVLGNHFFGGDKDNLFRKNRRNTVGGADFLFRVMHRLVDFRHRVLEVAIRGLNHLFPIPLIHVQRVRKAATVIN